MVNQSNFEGATLELLRRLKEKKQATQTRHAQELAEIDREIEAVSTTARLLRETGRIAEPIRAVKNVIPKDLDGKSTREACIEIAKLNNGVVRVSDARDVLLTVGILKKRKNAWGVVYTTMNRADEFEKDPIQPGVFRLVASIQPQEQSLLQ